MRKYLYPLIIFFCSCAPLLWFRDGCLIAGGDGPFLIDPVSFFQNYARYPLSDMNGFIAPGICLAFPTLLFFQILSWLGASLIISQKLLFVSYFCVAGFSMYYLMSVLSRYNDVIDDMAKMYASLLYMFNYFVILVNPMLTQFIAYALAPLVLGLFIRGIHARLRMFERSFLFACAASFLAPAFTNPPFLSIVVLLCLLYLLYILVFFPTSCVWVRAAGFLFLSAVMLVLFNMWFFEVWRQHFAASGSVSVAMLPGFWNPGATLDKTFILQGNWAWNERYFPGLYEFYQYKPFKIALYGVPLCVFLVLLRRQRGFQIYFFLLIAFAGLFFAKGRWGLWGRVYEVFFDHFPLFWIYREPYAKFTLGTIMAYAVIAGVVLSWITVFLSKKTAMLSKNGGTHTVVRSHVFVPVFIAMILSNAWPLISGDVIPQRRYEIPSFHVRVPDYWKRAVAWLNAVAKDVRVLVLPENRDGAVWLAWEHGFAAGGEPLVYMLNKSVIHSPKTNQLSNDCVKQIYAALRYRIPVECAELCNLLNIQYIVQRNDYLWNTLQVDSPEKVRSFLGDQKYIRPLSSYGKLDVYEVTSSSASPFAAVSGVTGVFGGAGSYAAVSRLYPLAKIGCYFFDMTDRQRDAACFDKQVKRIVFWNSTIDDLAKYFADKKYHLRFEGSTSWQETDSSKRWIHIADTEKLPLGSHEKKILSGFTLSNGSALFTTAASEMVCGQSGVPGLYGVFIRMAVFPENVGLSVTAGGYTLALSVTDVRRDGKMYWYDAGDLLIQRENDSIHLRNQGGGVLVDDVLIIPRELLVSGEKSIQQTLLTKGISVDYVFSNLGEQEGDRRLFIPLAARYQIRAEVDSQDPKSSEMTVVVNGRPVTLRSDGAMSFAGETSLLPGHHTIKLPTKVCTFMIGEKNTSAYEPLPQVAYKRYGPARYRIEVSGAQSPFYLVFKAPFDRLWKLYQDTESERPIKAFDVLSVLRKRSGLRSVDGQLMLYGYANAYPLPPASSAKYVLEHEMQYSYEKGVAVSLLSFGLGFVVLLLQRLIRLHI